MQDRGVSREVGVKSRALFSEAQGHILMPQDKLDFPSLAKHNSSTAHQFDTTPRAAGQTQGKTASRCSYHPV